jgi:hypothetical protein
LSSEKTVATPQSSLVAIASPIQLVARRHGADPARQ